MAKKTPTDVELSEELGEAESEVVLSYPAKTPKLDELIAKWKEQRRIRCCHKKSEDTDYPGTCFYPLNPVFNADHHHIIVETEDGPAIQAECSWDKRHIRRNGKAQFILLSDLKPPEES